MPRPQQCSSSSPSRQRASGTRSCSHSARLSTHGLSSPARLASSSCQRQPHFVSSTLPFNRTGRLQDTPSIKMTYTATVAVHEPLRALMSAETDEGASDPKQSRFSGKLGGPTNTFSFKQSIPVPSYLLALAVGELQSHRIGPRSRVWAEPPVLEAAAWEFAETEQYLAAGGPPRHTRNDHHHVHTASALLTSTSTCPPRPGLVPVPRASACGPVPLAQCLWRLQPGGWIRS